MPLCEQSLSPAPQKVKVKAWHKDEYVYFGTTVAVGYTLLIVSIAEIIIFVLLNFVSSKLIDIG
jgi:hypothetical protein